MRWILVALVLLCGCGAPAEQTCSTAAVRAESRVSTCAPDIQTASIHCPMVAASSDLDCTFQEKRICSNGITKTTFIARDEGRPAVGSVEYHDTASGCRVTFDLAEIP